MNRRLVAVVGVLALVAVVAGWWLLRPSGGTTLAAYFDRAVGLYAGSDVRVLGVKVGTVDRVTPDGTVVRVDMTVDDEFPIPPNASAAVVAPSLVSDRYVQLTPAYVEGPKMASGAVIPRERTGTPVEIDQVLKSVDTLAVQLGPNGANRTGALSQALNTGAANLAGNGVNLNASLTRLGALADTLARSRGDFAATVDNLDKFTGTLVEHDAEVRQLQSRLADVMGHLGGEHEKVGDALNALAGSLGEVNSFVKDNRELLASNVEALSKVTEALANERKSIAGVVDTAALGSSNYLNAYDAASRSIAVRGAFPETQLGPVVLLCTILQRYSPSVFQQLTQTCVAAADGLEKATGIPSIGDILGNLQAGRPPVRTGR